MMPVFLTPDDVESLEYELIPKSARVKLTRLLSRSVNRVPIDDPETHFRIRFLNRIINKANNLAERPIYVLESDYWGYYSAAEIAWHESEFEVCIRRLDSAQFIELLAEVVEEGLVPLKTANDLLNDSESSARLQKDDRGQVSVHVTPLLEDEELDQGAHPNLRKLVARMDRDLREEDYAAALANSASAIEVISKQRIGTQKVANQTFGAYFQKYKKDSKLPEAVIDWMNEIYKRRNTEPLAAHGQLDSPKITGEEAALIVEMVKAFARFERWSTTHQAAVNP